jgi:hypothetical protein
MREEPEIREELAAYVRAAARPQLESELLTDRLMRSCWPGGHDDRDEPVARGWLRLWGPVKVVVAAPVCRCDQGRCAICN